MDSDVVITASLSCHSLSDEDQLDSFLKERNLKITNIDCRKSTDKHYEITYVEITFKNIKQEKRIILPKSEFDKIYNNSKEVMPSKNIRVSIGELGLPIQNESSKYKIGVGKIKERLDISESDIIKHGSAVERNYIIVEVVSDLSNFLDFWWEELKDGNLYIKRIYKKNKKVQIDSDFAVFLISRGRDGGDIKESEGKETSDFFIKSFIDNKRIFFINNLFITYFNEKSNLFRKKSNILHVIGHGDGGNFYVENEKTEEDPTRYSMICNEDFIKLLRKKKVNIINLAFCFSGYNDRLDGESLPSMFLSGGIANYVIASKGPAGTNFLNEFNDYFYGNLFRRYKDVGDAFYHAKIKVETEHMEKGDDYKNFLTLFELDS